MRAGRYAVAVGATLWATPVHAVPPECDATYRLGVTIDVERGVLVGEMEVELTNPTPTPLREAVFRLLPNHFRHAPRGLEEASYYWVYPGDFEAGGLDLEEVLHDGLRVPRSAWSLERGGRIARIALARAVPPGARTRIRMRYRVHVPRRFGRFGRTGSTMTLVGGAYPELAALGPGGFREEDPAPPSSFLAAWSVPESLDVVVNGRLLHPRASGDSPSGYRRVVTSDRAAYLSLSVGPRLAERRRVVPGGEVVWIGPRTRTHEAHAMSTAPLPEELPGDSFRAAETLDALVEARRFLGERGLTLGSRRLVAVEVPLRASIASVAPGAILVSDRAFEITPSTRLLRLHRIQVMLAAFTSWAREALVNRERPADLPWVSEVVANALVEAYILARWGGVEYLDDILGPVAIHPAIDDLLYAPTIQFSGAYFASREIGEAIREEPERFLRDGAGGRRVHALLVERLGERSVRRIVREYVSIDRPGAPTFRQVVEHAAGEDPGGLFDEWLGPYPRVAYRLGRVRSVRTPSGAWMHDVTIVRMGDDVREPVVLELRTDEGEVVRRVWDARGRKGRVRTRTRGSIASAVVDPDSRLIEAPDLAPNHPRFDNRTPVTWRPPLVNGLRFELAADAPPSLGIDLTMRRKYELVHTLRVGADSSARGIGVSARYLRGFGRQRTLNSTEWHAGPAVTLRRTAQDTLPGAPGGWTVSLGLAALHETRLYTLDPWSGAGFSVQGGPVLSMPDGAGPARVAGSMSVQLTQVGTPAPTHTFALTEGAGVEIGQIVPGQQPSLRTAAPLRAYAPTEAIGRARLWTVGEYRHMLVTGLDGNILRIAWMRSLQAVFFAGAGFADEPSQLFRRRATYLEVGTGLRLHVDWGGLQQGLLALDVALPLSRTLFDWTPDCVQQGSGGRECFPPVGVTFGLEQAF